jgi:hypothetical protein
MSDMAAVGTRQQRLAQRRKAKKAAGGKDGSGKGPGLGFGGR